MLTTLKVLAWCIMAIALLLVGTLIATVQMLRPEKLTPIVETVANKMLNADVSLCSVELRLKGNYPFLNVTVDSLVVASRDIRALSPPRRDSLPQWADTLLSLRRFSGGINLPQTLLGKIHLSDVVVDAIGVNVVSVDSLLNNYTIVEPSDSEDQAMQIPDFSISSFTIVNPKEIRYADIADSIYARVSISDATIADARSDTLQMPMYKISVHTNLASPLLRQIQGQSIDLGCNGNVEWNHRHPMSVRFADFDFAVSELAGRINSSVNFDDDLTIETLDVELQPLSLPRVLDLLSDEAKREYSIPSNLYTDMSLCVNARLLDPYTVGRDSIPHMLLNLDVPDTYVRWRRLNLLHFELAATLTMPNDNLDSVTVDIKKFSMAGPATSLKIKGVATNMISDPAFDGSFVGDLNLNNLPPVLTQKLDGATLRGQLTMNTKVKASMSMLDPNKFHKMRVSGTIDGKYLWYAAPDTSTVLFVTKLGAKFGTNESIVRRGRTDAEADRSVDSMLTASIRIDSLRMLDSGLSVAATDLRFGIGTKNRAPDADTTAIIPIGGAVSLDRLSLTVLQDSSMLNVRKVRGSLTVQRYQGNAHLPMLAVNADIGTMGAGTPTMRFMVRQAHLDTRLHKKQVTNADTSRRFRARVDTVAADTSDIETIDFGTTREMRRLMRNWRLDGTLSATRARLFTAAFPLRNRIDSLRITFCNDSIVLDRTNYVGGKSDFVVSGAITNIQRAVSAARQKQPLKISLNVESDTIDINQLANAFFTGAANTDLRINGDLDESALDEDIALAADGEATGPLLIPVNIDLSVDAKARNVIYSDLMLHNFSGEVLVRDGALSLRNLRAASSVGSIDFSALYCAPKVSDMKFGMTLDLSDFNIRNFLNLMPSVDSIMPMIGNLGGIISAKVVATSDVDKYMNLILPSLNAAINIEGDSLVFLDEATFKTVSKWLMFKDKNKNMINHVSAEMIVKDNQMQMFPFIFDFDRYRLGVQGTNDLDMNYNYHVAVLKSPLPFKFGINIKGDAEDFKVRIGKARFNEKQSLDHALVDTTRINLISQFEDVFRRGASHARLRDLRVNNVELTPLDYNAQGDTISATDSLYMKQNGLFDQ